LERFDRMSEPLKLVRLPSLKTVAEFRRHVASLGIELPCEDEIIAGSASPLAQPSDSGPINGKTPGNRVVIQPMEGWDATPGGGATEEMLRRWRRFGESGAKLVFGCEAMAVCPEGRASPRQFVIHQANQADLVRLRETLVAAHRERHGTADDLAIGFQLTHSGRYCRPNDHHRLEPRVAYRHPILDRRLKIESDEPVMSDAEVGGLVRQFVAAARIAREAGADFVDIKHCHGYLLHEFLSAFNRSGPYGGSFENRTRILREIVAGIRADGNPIDLAVRLSAFDFAPFRPDPARSEPGRPGPGIPEDFSKLLPYRWAFGANQANPVEYDLGEPIQFVELCAALGIKIVNLTAGSPYYNPHIQRPAAYPPSDGYQPPHDPLIDVARQAGAVRLIKARTPRGVMVVSSGLSYLQEYLPHVAQGLLRNGWTDAVGIGRMALSYPGMLADAVAKGTVAARQICRTFSDCTTAPRHGLVSGCYPLDAYYGEKAEARELKAIKRGPEKSPAKPAIGGT
jgi:2,4-dienoyl-CoA reductase-like NADH-dependent reductase (Old Yellow Enzyme family)